MLEPDPGRITPEWMTAALRRSGAVTGARVIGLDRAPVGNGLVADCFRFALAYDTPEPGAPASVVGKFPARDPTSRKSGTDHQLYVRETSFYRELAGSVAIHTPRVHVAEIDPATDDFTLILADLGPARQGDQLAGCTIADAHVAMVEAAALHAPRWGDPALAGLDWLAVRPALLGDLVAAALPTVVALFKDRYREVLAPDHVALIDRLPAVQAAMRADRPGPRTIVHFDFRLDNMLFDVNGGERPMATLDWQTVGLGAGPIDVAYFLSAGIDADSRRAHETEFVGHYHAELLRRGVRDYDFAACWRDYRRHAVHGVMMGVFSALSVERTPRGDALFLRMTRGACDQALDHDSFDLWE